MQPARLQLTHSAGVARSGIWGADGSPGEEKTPSIAGVASGVADGQVDMVCAIWYVWMRVSGLGVTMWLGACDCVCVVVYAWSCVRGRV